jgi:hypothetical protein
MGSSEPEWGGRDEGPMMSQGPKGVGQGVTPVLSMGPECGGY